MISAPPFPNAPDRRRLAAIVFTDVAGFSARMQVEEAVALRLLERDFEVMRESSKEHSGTVLKSTGDGLLIYFTSAVHAVNWSLHIQRHFAEQAKKIQDTEVLRHRVGVHVGDVFVKADDVMGDGVNIASRVQAEAPPGGICISQTVYDLVKNKMQLHVIRLEPRKLKNIRENIPMFHLLLEEPVQAPAPVIAPRPVVAPVPVSRRAPRPKSRPGLALLLLLAIAAGSALLVQKYFDHVKELDESHSQLGQLAELTKTREPDPEAQTTNPPSATAAANATPDEGINFVKVLAENPNGTSDPQIIREANQAIAVLETWRRNELANFNADRPLRYRPLRGGGAQTTIYVEGGLIKTWGGGAVRSRDWEVIPRDDQAAILAALIENVNPPRPIVRGAEAFALVHRIPELVDALQRRRQLPGR